MNKSDLIAKLAARYPQLVAKDVEAVVKAILDAITMTMAKGARKQESDYRGEGGGAGEVRAAFQAG